MNLARRLGVVIGTCFALASAQALPMVSQSFTFSGSAGNSGSLAVAGIGTTWVPAQPVGGLDSITGDVTFSSTVSAFNVNPFEQTLPWNVFVQWQPRLVLFLPDGSTRTIIGAMQSISNSGLVGPQGVISVQGSFHDTLHLPAYGTALTGTSPVRLMLDSLVYGGTQFGGVSHSGDISANLIYNVPESTGVAPLLMLALLPLALVRAWGRGASPDSLSG